MLICNCGHTHRTFQGTFAGDKDARLLKRCPDCRLPPCLHFIPREEPTDAPR